jgi:hypothetical protein
LEEDVESRDVRLYVPGTLEIEKGEVTWHQLRAPEDAAGDITVRDRALEEGAE